MARRKWDESKVKRDESGRFIAHVERVDAQYSGRRALMNQFDPLKGPGQRTRLNAQTGEPVGPLNRRPPRRRSGSSSGGSMWIQVGGKSKSRTY